MNMKIIARSAGSLVLVFLLASFTGISVPEKFSPVGTWEYNVPGVPEGYDRGIMVISEGEEGLIVSIGPSQDYLTPTQDVELKKKTLSFKVIVEYEEVVIQGEFENEQFSGTVSYVEGAFDMTANRMVEE